MIHDGSHLRKLKELGRGSFGCANLMLDTRTNEHVVVKDQCGGNAQRAASEARIMSSLVHRNVVKYLGAWETTDAESGGLVVHIAMEYCNGGTMKEFLAARSAAGPLDANNNNGGGGGGGGGSSSKKKPSSASGSPTAGSTNGDGIGGVSPAVALSAPGLTGALEERHVAAWTAEIAHALFYCHLQHILHRDLKAENVLIHDGRLRLADFGLSRTLAGTADFANTRLGTPQYLAPEVYQHAPYNNRADMWSLGVILFEMMALRRPFTGQNMQELVHNVSHREPRGLEELRQSYSDDLVDLCAALLSKNPKDRPSAREVLTHRALRGVGHVPRPPRTSVVDAERESASWRRIAVKANTETSRMLILKPELECRVNVREAPSLTASIVAVVQGGDTVEQIGTVAQSDSPTARAKPSLRPGSTQSRGGAADEPAPWLKLVNGYCISRSAQFKGDLFRAVPEWRVLRPSQAAASAAAPNTGSQQKSGSPQKSGPPAGSGANAGPRPPSLPPTPNGRAASGRRSMERSDEETAVEVANVFPSTKDLQAVEAAMNAAAEFRTAREQVASLRKFLTRHGVKPETTATLLSCYSDLATEHDDLEWTILCRELLIPAGKAHCACVLRAIARSVPLTAQEETTSDDSNGGQAAAAAAAPAAPSQRRRAAA